MKISTQLDHAHARLSALVAERKARAAHDEFLSSIYVRLADGRIAHPHSHSWVDTIPDGARVWDSLLAFEKLTLPDGSPSKAAPYQEEFLKLFQPNVAFLGGVGSGKTVVGARRLTEAALLNPNSLSIVGGPTSASLDINTLHRIEEALPRWALVKPRIPHGDYRYWKKSTHHYYYINWKNGHRTIAMTLNSKTKSYLNTQGPSASFLWLDEGARMDKGAIDVFYERLRDERGMLLQFIITTSLDEPGWMESEYLDKESGKPVTQPDLYAVVEASTEGATFRGTGYVERLKAQYGEEQYRRKVKGELVYYEGLVYRDHLPCDINEPCWLDYIPDKSRPITIALDLGFKRSAYVVGQEEYIIGTMVDVIFDEGTVADTSAAQLAWLLQEKYRKWTIDHVYTDYSTTSEPDRRTIRGILKGVSVSPAINRQNSRFYRVEQGVNLVRHQCRDHQGERHLYIAKSLHGNTNRGTDMQGIREALSMYVEPPNKKRYHILDALRYYILGKHGPTGTVHGG